MLKMPDNVHQRQRLASENRMHDQNTIMAKSQ